jgi:FemAB-related protein (PEP-CTERM system-associated)
MATAEFSAPVTLPGRNQQKSVPVNVVPFEDSCAGKWDAFVLLHPKGTFFHQIGWKRVMEKTYGYFPLYFYAERGGQITGVAPVFLISSWVTGRCLMSLPFAVYGGICAADKESEEALLNHLEELAGRLNVEFLELRNRDGGVRPGYFANPRYATFTIPLVSEPGLVYDSFPKDIRYMIRKGEKAGLRVRRGFQLLDQFYALMTLNLRRLGTPAFPRSLFENLIHEYRNQVDLTVVYAGDKAIAGGMSFFFRKWMQPYYIGATEESKVLAANNFLWWELIRLGAERGCQTFDFGRSKKESGNYAFKKKWNPNIESLDYQVRPFRRKDLPNFSPANPRFQLATILWKKVPLGLTRLVGPRVVRWFP